MNVNLQNINMDNLQELFMAMSMNGNTTIGTTNQTNTSNISPNSPFQCAGISPISPISTTSTTTSNFDSPMTASSDGSNTAAYAQAINRPVDVEMGEDGLTAYQQHMLFVEWQDQLCQQLEYERMKMENC